MRHAVSRITVVFVVSSFLVACSHHLDLSKSRSQMKVGATAARENLWREALFRFNRASQLDPQNAAALNNLAVAYEGNGEFEKARQLYIEALRLDKGNPYIQKNYSRFVEFYSKNRKRNAQEAAVPPNTSGSSTPSSSAPATGTAVKPPVTPPVPAAPGAAPPSVPTGGPSPTPPPPNPTPTPGPTTQPGGGK